MEKIKALFKKLVNRETITYVIFGVLTTLVNLVVFKGCDVLFKGEHYLISNSVAWIAAVAFAYVTNKLFVFESKSWKFDVIKKEIPSFLGARIASYFIEQAGLWFFVEILNFDEKVFDFLIVKLSGKITAKLIIGVIVVIINYVLSKFMIFAKKENEHKAAENGEES